VPLVSADPLRSLLPHVDPFSEPGQVGTRGDAKAALCDSSWRSTLLLAQKPPNAADPPHGLACGRRSVTEAGDPPGLKSPAAAGVPS
jgi:hypothetical protein